MKTYFTVTILTFLSLPLFAQLEFAPVGAEWVMNASADNQGSPFFHPLADYYTIQSTGDTIIDGQSFRKVGAYYLYQDGDKVYNLLADSLGLIYDFGVEVGDTVTFDLQGCCSEYSYSVDEVSYISVDQSSLKKIVCKPLNACALDDYVYIEKIGSPVRLIENLIGCDFLPIFSPDWLRCYSDGDISHKTEKFISYGEEDCLVRDTITSTTEIFSRSLVVRPNPVIDYLSIDLNSSEGNISLSLLNVHGEVVIETSTFSSEIFLGDLSAGIYLLIVKNKEGVIHTEKILKN